MATANVPRPSDAEQVGALLDSPEIGRLVDELEATRWTGRPGYPLRAMVGMALAKSMYAVPTWTRTVALVREHAALQAALGCEGNVPSVYAAYRFSAKLRAYKPLLDTCLARVTASLHAELPVYGRNLAIDGSDLPAYANGQRFVSKGGRERSDDEFSDPDASWGHRSAVSTRKGRGVLRLQAPRGGVRRHGPSGGVGGGERAGRRAALRGSPARRGEGTRLRSRDVRDGQGLRRGPGVRGLRGP